MNRFISVVAGLSGTANCKLVFTVSYCLQGRLLLVDSSRFILTDTTSDGSVSFFIYYCRDAKGMDSVTQWFGSICGILV